MDQNLIDFSSDTNFVKTNVKLNCLTNSVNIDTLFDMLSKKYNIKSNNIELFSSEEALILSILQLLKPNYITIYTPIPTYYIDICNMFNVEIDLIDCLSNINRGVKENSLIIFANPSLASGEFYELKPFLEAWDKIACKVIIIETALEYSNKASLSKFIEQYDNIYIVKNIAKIFGSTIFDTSVLISSAKNIKKIKNYKQFKKPNMIELDYLYQSLNDKSFFLTFKAINYKNSLLLENILKNSEIFDEVLPPYTNIILTKLKIDDFIILQKYLKKHNIIIEQNITMIDSLIATRFCTKKTKELLMLEKLLKEFNKN